MDALYRAEVLIAAGCFIAAAVIYGLTPWYKSPAGRALFLVLTNFAIILTLVATSFWFGNYVGREIVRLTLYTLTMVNGMILLVFVITAQIIGYRKDQENDRRIYNPYRDS